MKQINIIEHTKNTFIVRLVYCPAVAKNFFITCPTFALPAFGINTQLTG